MIFVGKKWLRGIGENSGGGKKDKYIFSLMYRIHIDGRKSRREAICREEGTRKTRGGRVRQENEGCGYEQSTKLHVEECHKILVCVLTKKSINHISLNPREEVHYIACDKHCAKNCHANLFTPENKVQLEDAWGGYYIFYDHI